MCRGKYIEFIKLDKGLAMEDKNLYYFTFMKKNYVFSAYNHKVLALDNKTCLALEENKVNVKEGFEENEVLLKSLYDNKISFRNYNEPKCFVTINYSNECNLNCTYCYRNTNNKMKLNVSDLENIIKFSMTKYRLDATAYVFSLGFTSEPLLYIDLLKQFDRLIAKYEGYLFKKESFCSITPKELFLSLPIEIQNKYCINYDDDKIMHTSVFVTGRVLYDSNFDGLETGTYPAAGGDQQQRVRMPYGNQLYCTVKDGKSWFCRDINIQDPDTLKWDTSGQPEIYMLDHATDITYKYSADGTRVQLQPETD